MPRPPADTTKAVPGATAPRVSISVDELAIGFTLGLLHITSALVIALIAHEREPHRARARAASRRRRTGTRPPETSRSRNTAVTLASLVGWCRRQGSVLLGGQGSSSGPKASIWVLPVRGASPTDRTRAEHVTDMPKPRLHRRNDAALGLGWLCPTEASRARMLDMGPRIARARTIAVAATGAGTLAAIGDVGWPAVAGFAVAIVNVGTLERRIQRAVRPERVVAASLLLILWLLGFLAALTGGAVSPFLAWLVTPVAMAAIRFRAQVVWATAVCAALTAVVVALATGVQRGIDHPLTMIALFVLLIAVTAVTTALMDAELQFRSKSVLDPLTGLLNRSGLGARFAEVGEQARLLNRPVCLIMCDLDHFKRVNDDHGHERGDAVLSELSYEMRRSLRSFELFYRLGGEEFLVLLPGIDLLQGVEVADSLRAVVESSCPAGLPVTASFGVSVASGEHINFLPLYRAADDALYRAKAKGGNLVVASEMSPALDDALAVVPA